MSAFHAYDIRGIYNTDFNKETVYRIGYYLPQVLDAKKILIGRDARASSPEIHDALINGLKDAGCDIYDAGLSTTPMIYWGTAKFEFEASVMITASHNPAEYNGLKISARNAVPVGYDTGLNKLEELIEQDIVSKKSDTSSLHEFDFKNDYTEYLKSYSKNISDLNLTIDCSNGMAGLFVRSIFGNTPHYLFEELDGTFPNHEPNPLNEKNLVQIQEAVLTNKSDIGVIFDGDADRVMFVDENGTFIPPDLMIALLGHYFLEEKNLKGKVIQDIRTSKSVAEYLEPMGAEMEIWRVGRAYAANKLREIDGIFGGELAGHYYFRDFYYSDSGMLAAVLILNLISRFKREGKTVSTLISNIRKYENSGEINFRIEQKREAMEAVKETLMAAEKAEKFLDFDGYRIEFSDWWFNIRPSNTEPYLRLLVEARNNKLLEEKVNHIREIIGRFK
ncbi:MAG: phosphomannomutase/phosphoglucomutase [Marinilabiliales bacterium]|nr:MAG: phosphomannomutase/phosphoglucomutase [Marinilabiliales bacterium]